MGKIEINDLNEEIIISEEEIKHVNGGASFLKIGDIAGESLKIGDIAGESLRIGDFDAKGNDYPLNTRWKI